VERLQGDDFSRRRVSGFIDLRHTPKPNERDDAIAAADFARVENTALHDLSFEVGEVLRLVDEQQDEATRAKHRELITKCNTSPREPFRGHTSARLSDKPKRCKQ
jgi:hypothetical protein